MSLQLQALLSTITGQNGAQKRQQPDEDTSPNKKKRTTYVIIGNQVTLEKCLGLDIDKTYFISDKYRAWTLHPDDQAFLDIHEYVANSQEHNFGVKIVSILRIIFEGNDLGASPPDLNDDPNAKRMMLWHGTKKNVIESILQNGFRLPGWRCQMYGSGIYFADRVSKSCQYCDSITTGSTGFLLLCDVFLGQMYQTNGAMNHLTAAPETAEWPWPLDMIGPMKKYESVMGCGNYIPDKLGEKKIDGCVWPIGRTVANNTPAPFFGRSLCFNEYVAYNPAHVQPKYLVKVEFTRAVK